STCCIVQFTSVAVCVYQMQIAGSVNYERAEGRLALSQPGANSLDLPLPAGLGMTAGGSNQYSKTSGNKCSAHDLGNHWKWTIGSGLTRVSRRRERNQELRQRAVSWRAPLRKRLESAAPQPGPKIQES